MSPTTPRSENDLEVWTEEIRKVIGDTSALSSGKSKSKRTQKGKGTKRKRKDESEDDGTEDGDDS